MRVVSRFSKAIRGKSGRQVAKLLVYSTVCLAVLAGLVTRIGNIDPFAHRAGYEAVLPDATGLLDNDSVKVAGVAVGKVTGIRVHRGQAVVSFQVDDDVRLTRRTRVGIRWRNVLGQKYLYLYPGTGGKVLRHGDRLPASQAVEAADVGAFLNAIGPILRSIDPQKANSFIRAFNEALDDNESRVRSLLADSADIATSLGGEDQNVSSLIDHLDAVVGGLADRDGDLRLVIGRLRTFAGGLADNNDDLQLLVDRFADVQQKLDDLVTRNRGNIDATIDDLTTIVGVLHDHRDDLDRSLATLPEGLQVYDTISSYGQWFQIRARITCLANQATCSDDATATQLVSQLSPSATDARSIVAFALSGAGE